MLKYANEAMGIETWRKIYKTDEGLIHISSVHGLDRIRIEAEGAPWYFYRTSFDTTLSGDRAVYAYIGQLEATTLREVSLGTFDPTTSVAYRTVRGVGKSYSFIWKPSGAGKFLTPTGTVSGITDPLGVLDSNTALAAMSVAAELGRSRKALVWHDSSSREMFFTDGSMVQASDAPPSGAPFAQGVHVVGPTGEEDAYYWRVANDTGSTGYRFQMWLAERTQPTDGDGNPTEIAPGVVINQEVSIDLQDDVTFRRYVVANDWDVLTTLRGNSGYAAGALQIRISGTLYWSSPGTFTMPPFGVTTLADDVSVCSVIATDTGFVVTTINRGAHHALYDRGALTNTSIGVLLREIQFVRQDDGTYTSSEHTYTWTDVNKMDFAAAWSPIGYRAFVSVGRYTADDAYSGWIDFITGVLTTAKDWGALVDYPVREPIIVPLLRKIYAASTVPALTGIGFFDSETLGYAEQFVSASAWPVPLAIGGTDVQAYVLAGGLLSSLRHVVSADGVTNFQTTLGGSPSYAFTNLLVDEASRELSSVVASLSVATSPSGIYRCDVDTEETTQYGAEMHFGAGALQIPTLSEHYRRRLLQKWAAEDAEG